MTLHLSSHVILRYSTQFSHALRYNTLHCVTLHGVEITLHLISTHYITLFHITLQYATIHCITIRIMHCFTWRYTMLH